MPRRHAALALVVAVCWAVNFVVIVIDIGLESFPLLFVALRFGLTALPAILFVQRPDVRWPAVIAVGLFIGFGQFRLLFVAMNTELPAGLAPVIATLQPVFTIPLAAVALRERPSPRQVAGVSLAVAGIGAMAVGRAPTASPALRFRRSATLFQQRYALHMMRHREDTDDDERRCDPLRADALRRRNQPLTCGDAAPGTAGAGAVLRGFANQTEPIPSPPVSGLRRSQTTAAHRPGAAPQRLARRQVDLYHDEQCAPTTRNEPRLYGAFGGDARACGPSAAHGARRSGVCAGQGRGPHQ